MSGERPFHGNFTEIAVQHTVTPPPPLREKVQTILPDVEQVVMVALAKEPRERFGNVQAFAKALEQASQSDVVTFVKPPTAMPVAQEPRVVTPPSNPVVQTPPAAMPSSFPPTLPVYTPPLPPTQLAKVSQPVGTVVCTYRGHAGRVNAVAWSPDGKLIASASDDKTVQVWDVATGSSLGTYRGHSKTVRSRETIYTYRGQSGWVGAVAWSTDGKYIASGCDDKTVQVWVAP